MTPRLVLFDCDGTLVDSQHVIVGAMQAAWAEMGLDPPPPAAVRATVGLSPHQAMRVLAVDAADARVDALVAAYRAQFFARQRRPDGDQPLFPGIREALNGLAAAGHVLGIATGKSRRGLEAVLARHGLGHLFVTLQTADDAPSKPHPAMVLRALEATGMTTAATCVVGDTSYDMLMARAAGVDAVGVNWGYHAAEVLRESGARHVVDSASDLLHAIDADPIFLE